MKQNHPHHPDINSLPKEATALLEKGERREAAAISADDPELGELRRFNDDFTALFNPAVDYLRSKFPNPRINELAALFWNLVGNRITPTVLNPFVPSMGLAIAKDRNGSGLMQAYVCIPANWIDICKKDKWFAYGSIVFTASQCRDYYNDQFTHPNAATKVIDRARAYEAEYLRTLPAVFPVPGYPYNAYQKAVLNDFPQGLDSKIAQSLNYTSQPWPPLVIAIDIEPTTPTTPIDPSTVC